MTCSERFLISGTDVPDGKIILRLTQEELLNELATNLREEMGVEAKSTGLLRYRRQIGGSADG